MNEMSRRQPAKPAVSETCSGAGILEELRSAHRHLEACLADLQRVVDMPASPLAFTYVRFRFAQASLARRQLVRRACDYLLSVGDPRDRAVARSIKEQDVNYVSASSEHLAKWPASAVEADWAGFVKTSERMREMAREGILREKCLLFPLLSRY